MSETSTEPEDDALFDESEYADASAIQQLQADRLFDLLTTACDDADLTPDRILDVGCGDGSVTRDLADQFPSASITAIDESASLIDTARGQTDNPHITYRRADIETFDPDTRFDVVFANTTFHWITDQHALYQQVQSLLRENGVVAAHQGHVNCYKELREAAENAAAAVDEADTFYDFVYPLQYHTEASIDALLTGTRLDIQTVTVEESPRSGTLIEDFTEAGLLPYRDRIPDEKEDDFIDEFQSRARQLEDIDMSRLYFVAQKQPK